VVLAAAIVFRHKCAQVFPPAARADHDRFSDAAHKERFLFVADSILARTKPCKRQTRTAAALERNLGHDLFDGVVEVQITDVCVVMASLQSDQLLDICVEKETNILRINIIKNLGRVNLAGTASHVEQGKNHPALVFVQNQIVFLKAVGIGEAKRAHPRDKCLDLQAKQQARG
jgi:hypothetical protein